MTRPPPPREEGSVASRTALRRRRAGVGGEPRVVSVRVDDDDDDDARSHSRSRNRSQSPSRRNITTSACITNNKAAAADRSTRSTRPTSSTSSTCKSSSRSSPDRCGCGCGCGSSPLLEKKNSVVVGESSSAAAGAGARLAAAEQGRNDARVVEGASDVDLHGDGDGDLPAVPPRSFALNQNSGSGSGSGIGIGTTDTPERWDARDGSDGNAGGGGGEKGTPSISSAVTDDDEENDERVEEADGIIGAAGSASGSGREEEKEDEDEDEEKAEMAVSNEDENNRQATTGTGSSASTGNSDSDSDSDSDSACSTNITFSQPKTPYARPPAPPMPNPLHDPALLRLHLRSLKLEASLLPLRPVLSRLMAHSTYNRRGTFNAPVDAKALNLVDYDTVVTAPMDLGTIKARLHANAYRGPAEVASDVRLTFRNAMLYNPPGNPVNDAARNLWTLFEEWYASAMKAAGVEVGPPVMPPPLPPTPPSMLEESAAALPAAADAAAAAVAAAAALPPPTRGKSLANVAPSGDESTQEKSAAGVEVERQLTWVGASQGPITTTVKKTVDLDPLAPPAGCALAAATAPMTSPTVAGSKVYYSRSASATALATATAVAEKFTDITPLSRRPFKHVDAPPHYCGSCKGRTCSLCDGGCLALEPTLLICNGSGCRGAKIRRGAFFFAADDGTKQWCQRCYSNLPAVIPDEQDAAIGLPGKYKRDLLKRRNDEEVVERWITCTKCGKGMHQVCAIYDSIISDNNAFVCPPCVLGEVVGSLGYAEDYQPEGMGEGLDYTFVAGDVIPQNVSPCSTSKVPRLDAKTLPSCAISSFIEKKVQARMLQVGCPVNAEKTIDVRLISENERNFQIPDVIRRHFRMEVFADVQNDQPRSSSTKSSHDAAKIKGSAAADCRDRKRKRRKTLTRSSSSLGEAFPFVSPPAVVKYHSKAIALFQRIDGVDVCVFCMYVQEYDGDDEVDADVAVVKQKKRVYIAYLDSVEHFRPRSCRTEVFHEILVAYLASARARGYENAHIWACPPVRGNSFVFWSHPASQKTPTRDRLTAWYHGSLSRAVKCGVVTDVKSLYEHSFKKYDKSGVYLPSSAGASPSSSPAIATSTADDETIMVCPPLLDGDMWIEEAVRLHSLSVSRHLKNRTSFVRPENATPATSEVMNADQSIVVLPRGSSCCPAIQVADLLHSRILAHPSSAPFRRPVNAAALKLKDYHAIITQPMDLGTVHSRILLGEYDNLRHLVSDVELVFKNAMLYNPKGHFVYSMAVQMRNMFFRELDKLAELWSNIGVDHPHACGDTPVEGTEDNNRAKENNNWRHYRDLSMRLSTFLDFAEPEPSKGNGKSEIEVCVEAGIARSNGTESANGTVADVERSVADMDAPKSNASPVDAPQVMPQDAESSDTFDPRLSFAKISVPEPSVEASSSEKTMCSVSTIDPKSSRIGASHGPVESEMTILSDAVALTSSTSEKIGKDAGISSSSADVNPIASHIIPSPAKRDRQEHDNKVQSPLKKAKKSTNPKPSVKLPSPKLNILTDGPNAIAQRMVGEDSWLFDKKTAITKNKGKKKKAKKICTTNSKPDIESDLSSKKLKESWLGDNVGVTIRKMRRDFFVCNLTSEDATSEEKQLKGSQFADYVSGFDMSYNHGCATIVDKSGKVTPGIADARHALLEFSQYRNLEFDTLRRAKHSTAILLYYLHNPDAPGLVPVCSACNQEICQIRWHRMKKLTGQRRRSCTGGFSRRPTTLSSGSDQTEKDLELCQSCYSLSKRKETFIPIRISFERVSH